VVTGPQLRGSVGEKTLYAVTLRPWLWLLTQRINSKIHSGTVPQTVKARIAPGAIDGQRLRLPGKGGQGFNGGRAGDLYLDISLKPHPLYRATGHDLYVDLPLAPWEAALGASVEVPTPGGLVSLKVRPGTSSGQKLRLAGRGLPKPRGGSGDLYAVAQIMVPAELSERERELYSQLQAAATVNPRRHMENA
jgi:curved DNA-binding protein